MAMDASTKPPPLPCYSEMILGAIEALDDKAGSDKASISTYIESKYAGQLPEAHSTLLSIHLGRMYLSGMIVLLKNNYLKAFPPKRGRGRPRKVRPPPPGAELGSRRRRGRPPKLRDPLAAAVEKEFSGMPKRRGRPPKKAQADREEGPAPTSPGSLGAVPGVKRGRGRPPKLKPPFAYVGFA